MLTEIRTGTADLRPSDIFQPERQFVRQETPKVLLQDSILRIGIDRVFCFVRLPMLNQGGPGGMCVRTAIEIPKIAGLPSFLDDLLAGTDYDLRQRIAGPVVKLAVLEQQRGRNRIMQSDDYVRGVFPKPANMDTQSIL
jgi:hypothetical protein